MVKISKLLACVDLSDYSQLTLEYTSLLMQRLQAQTLVLNVINVRDIEALRSASEYYPEVANVENYIEERKKMRQQLIHRMILDTFAQEQANVQVAIRVGNPIEEILETIEQEEVDLVIMGNKGRSNLTRTLFGSTAEKIFRLSPVPVLSARFLPQFADKPVNRIFT